MTPAKSNRYKGSSPLARGLLDEDRLPSQVDGGRIIPARAGFTSSEACDEVLPADHPRSRGVYLPST